MASEPGAPEVKEKSTVTYGVRLPDGTPLNVDVVKRVVQVVGAAGTTTVPRFEKRPLTLTTDNLGNIDYVRANVDGDPVFLRVMNKGTIETMQTMQDVSKRVLSRAEEPVLGSTTKEMVLATKEQFPNTVILDQITRAQLMAFAVNSIKLDAPNEGDARRKIRDLEVSNPTMDSLIQLWQKRNFMDVVANVSELPLTKNIRADLGNPPEPSPWRKEELGLSLKSKALVPEKTTPAASVESTKTVFQSPKDRMAAILGARQ